MKYFVLVLLLLVAGPALASDLTDEVEAKCRVEYVDTGVYYTYCPKGSVAEAARTSHSNPKFMPYTRVACVKPVIVCTEEEVEE